MLTKPGYRYNGWLEIVPLRQQRPPAALSLIGRIIRCFTICQEVQLGEGKRGISHISHIFVVL